MCSCERDYCGIRKQLTTVILVIGHLVSTHPAGAEGIPEPAYHLAGGWQSRYTTEGRDNLDGQGICTVEGEVQYKGFTSGIWHGRADGGSFQELDLFVQYQYPLGDLDTYLGYTRLIFPQDGTSDNEIYAGFTVHAHPRLVPGMLYTHSTAANGGFLEISLRSTHDFLDRRLTITPYLQGCIDFGYVGIHGDGPRNFQIGADAGYRLTARLLLSGAIAHSWSLPDISAAGADDFFWAGIGLSYAF